MTSVRSKNKVNPFYETYERGKMEELHKVPCRNLAGYKSSFHLNAFSSISDFLENEFGQN